MSIILPHMMKINQGIFIFYHFQPLYFHIFTSSFIILVQILKIVFNFQINSFLNTTFYIISFTICDVDMINQRDDHAKQNKLK